MRISLAVGLVGLFVGTPGCCILEKITHGAISHGYVVETQGPIQETQECPIQDSADCLMSNRHYVEAVTNWTTFRQEHPAAYSDDFAWGFKQGFAAAVDAEGNAQTPPQPPRYYCQVKYETPQGYRAVDEWYAGYEHGAMAARGAGAHEHGPVMESGPLPEGATLVDESGQPVSNVSPRTMPAFQTAPATVIEEPAQPDARSAAPSALGHGSQPVMGMMFFEEKAKERFPTPPKDVQQDTPSWQPAGDEEITHLKPSLPAPPAKEAPTTAWHAAKPMAADATSPATRP